MVGVLVAAVGDGVLDDQPSDCACQVAVFAAQGAFEVVVVHLSPFPGGGAGVEDGLDAVEQMLVNERFAADAGPVHRSARATSLGRSESST
jgi:hypothetical protein